MGIKLPVVFNNYDLIEKKNTLRYVTDVVEIIERLVSL